MAKKPVPKGQDPEEAIMNRFKGKKKKGKK